ncbi:MAG: YceI family protein, partial [Acidimicrobiales bacterium]
MSADAVRVALTGTYTIDPSHSRIGFVARHAMVTKVRGSFNEFDGSGYLDATVGSSAGAVVVARSAGSRPGHHGGVSQHTGPGPAKPSG